MFLEAEAALVSPHFVSGTHTISCALFGVLRPGDELFYITGRPYDTLHNVIGKPGDGKDRLLISVSDITRLAPLPDGSVDWAGGGQLPLPVRRASSASNARAAMTGVPPILFSKSVKW